jgi:hypothetical protein
MNLMRVVGPAIAGVLIAIPFIGVAGVYYILPRAICGFGGRSTEFKTLAELPGRVAMCDAVLEMAVIRFGSIPFF